MPRVFALLELTSSSASLPLPPTQALLGATTSFATAAPRTVNAYAAFERGGEVKPWQYQSRPLGAEDVEIKISHCAICSADTQSMDGGYGPAPYPCVAGHEMVGQVTLVGSAVKHLAVGDRAGVGAQLWACLNKDKERPCVDGKTSLVRVLSTQLSTAALDKHPQSQQRGITLDLGFSAFRVPHEQLIKDGNVAIENTDVQITLVDCPGHASLFKTILGGARIIDMVLLVVDAQKGLQPQTIESLLVAELTVAHHVIIALNKVDLLLPESGRAVRIRSLEAEIRSVLDSRFPRLRGQSVPIVAVAASPADEGKGSGINRDGSGTSSADAVGISNLVETIRSHLYLPERDPMGPFSLAIDHCFAIQGNGTILTGTVLSGSIKVNDEVEIPSLQVVKKVKSMQMFKQSVTSATQGDRVAIRVNGLDASLVERGMAITPHSLPYVTQVVVPVHQIAFFQGTCKSGAKFHATINHTTVVAVATFFSSMRDDKFASKAQFEPLGLYEYVAQIEPIADTNSEGKSDLKAAEEEDKEIKRASYFALLQFDQPVLCPRDALVICSRLDLDPKKFACRLAFHGRIQAVVSASSDPVTSSPSLKTTDAGTNHVHVSMDSLRIGKVKSRKGSVDKAIGTKDSIRDVIAHNMFSKDVDWSVYTNVIVLLETSRRLGKILGPFGKTDKFRIAMLDSASGGGTSDSMPITGESIVLRFIKLMVLKSMNSTPKGKGGGNKRSAQGATSNSNKQKPSRNLLQVADVLYPEAFVAPQLGSRSENAPENEPQLTSTAPDTNAVDDASELMNATSSIDLQRLPRGKIERLKGETTVDHRNPFAIVSGLFTTEQDAVAAAGRSVVCFATTSAASETKEERGEIEKPFGKAGKVRVVFTKNGGTSAQVGDGVVLLSEDKH
ncbi:Translation elongation factor tu, partial [Globisporangium splendens]